MSATKTRRFTPPDTSRASSERLVLYELISLLRESAAPQMRERLISLQTRIPLIASETDVAQALAEEDGDALED